MITLKANIDVVREDGKLKTASVALPIWIKQREDDVLFVDIPMLNISTTAWDENDVETSLKEALTLFFLNCEKFGTGVENELKLAGWNFTQTKGDKTSMCWGTDDEVIERILSTGNDFAQTLELAI